MKISGYAALSPEGRLEPHEYELPSLASHEVRIRVRCCGLCASDLDIVKGMFSGTVFPLVPGHEVIGEVMERGDAVTHLQVGDRVGVGPQRDACGQCEWCVKGETQICRGRVFTNGAGHAGGFAEAIQVPASFAFPIPEALPSAEAAPLLCAGATVYSPLRKHMTGPGRVGVLGIGGLGHLAIQFARALGHEVVALCRAPTQSDIAAQRALGATEVVDIDDHQAMRGLRESLDLVLSLVYGEVKWNPLMAALRAHGTLCVIGASPTEFLGIVKHLVYAERRLVGSAASSRAMTQEMLVFAARHGIRAHVETMPMGQVNEAITRLRSGTLRYRAVLVAE